MKQVELNTNVYVFWMDRSQTYRLAWLKQTTKRLNKLSLDPHQQSEYFTEAFCPKSLPPLLISPLFLSLPSCSYPLRDSESRQMWFVLTADGSAEDSRLWALLYILLI